MTINVMTINVILKCTPEIVSGFSIMRLAVVLPDQIRTLLLEEHRCAPHLVQGGPDGEALTYSGSTADLHRLCQIPANRPCRPQSVFFLKDTVKEEYQSRQPLPKRGSRRQPIVPMVGPHPLHVQPSARAVKWPQPSLQHRRECLPSATSRLALHASEGEVFPGETSPSPAGPERNWFRPTSALRLPQPGPLRWMFGNT